MASTPSWKYSTTYIYIDYSSPQLCLIGAYVSALMRYAGLIVLHCAVRAISYELDVLLEIEQKEQGKG